MLSHLKKKARTKQYPAEIITDTDYADDLELFTNIIAQAENLLQNQEQSARGIGSTWTQNSFQSRWCHLLIKWQDSEIDRLVHIALKNYLINWKWCQNTSR